MIRFFLVFMMRIAFVLKVWPTDLSDKSGCTMGSSRLLFKKVESEVCKKVETCQEGDDAKNGKETWEEIQKEACGIVWDFPMSGISPKLLGLQSLIVLQRTDSGDQRGTKRDVSRPKQSSQTRSTYSSLMPTMGI